MKQHTPQPHHSIMPMLGNIGNSNAPGQEPGTAALKQPAQKHFEGIQLAYYPKVDKNCFAATMANYRRYVAVYNQEARRRNKEAATHNQNVKAFLSTCQDNNLKAYADNFPMLNSALNIHQYNLKALEECQRLGPIIRLRKIKTIKYPLQQTFSLILHIYNLQLQRTTARRLKYPTKQAQALPPVEVNSYTLSHVTCEENVLSLDVCPETVRNHRQILQDAGILVNYVYRGSYRGVHLHINPDILVFLDAETEKTTGTENQAFAASSTKESADVLVITRSLKEEEKSSPPAAACVDKVPGHTPAANALHEHLQEPSAALPLHEHTGTPTRSQPSAEGETGANSPGGGAPDAPEPVENPHSDALRALITYNTYDFGKRLANGDFDSYKPLSQQEFDREAYQNGNLSREDFVLLWVQNFLKYAAATLYKGRREIYPADWHNTHDHLVAQFKINGKNPQSKTNMASWYQEYKRRVELAEGWLLKQIKNSDKKRFMPPPSSYFNLNLKGSGILCFNNTKAFLQRELDKKNPEDAMKRKAERKMKIAKERKGDNAKYEKALDDWFKNIMDDLQFCIYLEKNLPASYQQRAIDDINKRFRRIDPTANYKLPYA